MDIFILFIFLRWVLGFFNVPNPSLSHGGKTVLWCFSFCYSFTGFKADSLLYFLILWSKLSRSPWNRLVGVLVLPMFSCWQFGKDFTKIGTQTRLNHILIWFYFNATLHYTAPLPFSPLHVSHCLIHELSVVSAVFAHSALQSGCWICLKL